MAGRSGLIPWDDRGAGWAILGLGMAGALAFVLLIGHGQTLVNDEWSYVTNRSGWDPETLLRPQNGHLVVAPLFLYKALYAVFGISSYLPFQIASFALAALIAMLVYLLARPGLGPLGAVLPALLVLFCGTGWDTVVAAYQLPNLMGMAAGLGSLLAIERRERRSDLLAAILLALSLASFSVGIAFAAGLGVALLLRGRSHALRAAWVVAAPLALYVVWFAWARKYDEGGVTAYAIASLAGGVLDQLGAIASGLAGLFLTPAQEGLANQLIFRSDWSAVLVVGLGALAVLRLRPSRRATVSPAFWVAAATLAVYLLLVGVALAPGREPAVGRYVFLGSVLLLVVLCLGCRGVDIRPPHLAVIAALVAVSLVSNAGAMVLGSRILRAEGQTNRAQLGALELIERPVPAPLVEPPDQPTLSHPDMFFSPATYAETIADFGSPAFSESELRSAPEQARGSADLLLARLLPIAVEAGEETAPGAGEVRVLATTSGTASATGGCVSLRPDAGAAAAILELPPGGAFYRATDGSAPSISLGRFADGFPVELASLPPEGAISIPGDRSRLRWRASVSAPTPLRVCPGAATLSG